ncbi:MAG: 30S ribosomal protein S24e [Candidatus Altiarchaeales archaeon]|nr:MAG: 30S ribosomal protein S24e [Candidatus Altiarchaeales archaeon]
MEIKIIEDKFNKLLNRREIYFIVNYDGATPSIKDVRNKLIAQLDADKELLIVDYIRSEFGMKRAKGFAKIYKDKEGMKIEPKHKIEKNFPKEEKSEG